MENSTLTLSSCGQLAMTRTSSAAPTALLIHGWTCRRADWHTTLSALQHDYSLAALDLPGHGDSQDAHPESWSIDALADVVTNAVQALTDQPITLVGHSMGGVVALETARRSDLVKAVVLVDTFVLPYGDLSEDEAQDIERPFYDDFKTAIEGLVENFTAPDIPANTKKQLKRQMQSANPSHMLPLWSDLLRWSPEPALAELRIPLHAINGDLIPEAAQERCKNRVEEWHLDGAGHFPQAEMPEPFQRQLDQLLDQLNGREKVRSDQ